MKNCILGMLLTGPIGSCLQIYITLEDNYKHDCYSESRISRIVALINAVLYSSICSSNHLMILVVGQAVI